jgi:sulfite reductase alpha subunit-like flavoprotein
MRIQRQLTPTGRDNRHFEWELNHDGKEMPYAVGDSLGIWPHNTKEKVDEFLNWYGLADTDVLNVEDLQRSRKQPLPSHMSAKKLFTEYLDVFGKPKRSFYENLALLTEDAAEKETLQHMLSGEGKDAYRGLVSETTTHFDLMKMFPNSVDQFGVDRMLDFIPDIKPRLYSIASDPDTTGQMCNLCIVADDWETPSGKEQRGVCTDFLMKLGDLQTEDYHPMVAAKVNPAAVHMPDDPKTPIVLTGLGTGLAPIRAIIQQRRTVRETQGIEVGPLCLIFGGRYASKDFLYEDEVNQWMEEGLLTDLICAWSRDGEDKVYVQHRITQNAELMDKYIVKGNGYFYLCGPAGNMPPQVRQAVVEACSEGSGMDMKDMDEYVTNMQINGRYNVEAW